MVCIIKVIAPSCGLSQFYFQLLRAAVADMTGKLAELEMRCEPDVTTRMLRVDDSTPMAHYHYRRHL